MSNHDTRNEYERIDALIDGGKAHAFPVQMPPEIPVGLEIHEIPRRKGRSPHYKFRFSCPDGGEKDIELYISPTGNSVHVFKDGVELS